MAIKQFNIILDWSQMITSRVCHLAFQLEAAELPAFIPGQFITLLIPQDDKILRRSFSIATVQGKSQHLEIAAGHMENGVATNLLFNLQPGESVTASGPFGRLILRDEDVKRYILVATGTGVTPYRAMLPQIAERLQQNPHLEIVLMLGVRKRDELLYPEEFLQFAAEHERFTFQSFYSREQPTDQKEYEYAGHVQVGFTNLNLNAEHDIVYLCGNPDMIDHSFELLKEQGFDAHNVRREKYISSGH